MLQDVTNVERLESSIETPVRGWENTGYASFDSITQPDTMLPAQFFVRRTPARVEGEMRLLIAVLEDAINTYVRCIGPKNHRQREELREVEAWFEGRGQSGLFAFENVCDVLGVEAGRVREWVRSLRDGAGPARTGMAANSDRPNGGRRGWRIYLGDRGRRTRGPSARRPRRRSGAQKSAGARRFPVCRATRYAYAQHWERTDTGRRRCAVRIAGGAEMTSTALLQFPLLAVMGKVFRADFSRKCHWLRVKRVPRTGASNLSLALSQDEREGEGEVARGASKITLR